MSMLWTQAAFAAAAVVVGGGLATSLTLQRPTVPKQPGFHAAPVVEVLSMVREHVPIKVIGHGTVAARDRARVVPQVSGLIVAVHPHMTSGGYVPAGEPLFTIDPCDYKLAVRQARADILLAEAEETAARNRIVEAEARLRDAEQDRARLNRLHGQDAASSVEMNKAEVAYQVAQAKLHFAHAKTDSAQALLEMARTALQKAEINLRRTQVTMPFDAIVMDEDAVEGQHVTAGQAVAEVYGTGAVEISVPLQNREMKWLGNVSLHGRAGHPEVLLERLPYAQVFADFGGKSSAWRGRVVRIEGQIDARSQTVRIVVVVNDPFMAGNAQPALLPGTFVRVEIDGSTLSDVFVLPRSALHNQDEVWVASDNLLNVRKIEIVYRDRQRVCVASGLKSGERVVISQLDAVTTGMSVRIRKAN